MGRYTKPAREFKDTELVQQHIRLAGQAVAQYAAENYEVEMEQRLDSNSSENGNYQLEFDSPLEAVCWVWWMALRRIDTFCRMDIELERQLLVEVCGVKYVLNFAFVPTAQRRQERPDIVWPRVGIELDGHAFHEKTREQATYRNQRDRALQQAGWTLFYFSFDEFTKEPFHSLFEIVEHLRESYGTLIYGDRSKQMGKYLPLA